MAATKPSRTQINLGIIVIKGAPDGTSAARFNRAIRQGLDRALGGSELTGSVGKSVDIPRLMLQLPPRATEAEIVQALVHALARIHRGDRL